MRWVCAAIAIVFAGLAGFYFGGQLERKKLATELSDYQSRLATQEEEHESEMVALRTQRDVADKSNREMQASLQELQKQTQAEQAAINLYDRIEGSDTSTGLAVDTVAGVEDENGVLSELHITLIQARGRERVSGKIGVSLLGEKDDINWREVIVQASGKKAPRFDMRFFQTLVIPVPENNVLVDIVEIEVVPDGKRHKPFNHEVAWSGIFQE